MSTYWRPQPVPEQDRAWLLDPHDPADAGACREVAGVLASPEIGHGTRCLSLSLASVPDCRMLFVRVGIQPPFSEQDTQRVLRYAAQCGQIIRNGCLRENSHTDTDPLPISNADSEPSGTDILARLSHTEYRVLQRLQMQETERQAAEALGRSPNTIHVHVKSIYRKLQVCNRRDLLSLLDQIEPANDMQQQTPTRQAQIA